MLTKAQWSLCTIGVHYSARTLCFRGIFFKLDAIRTCLLRLLDVGLGAGVAYFRAASELLEMRVVGGIP